VADRPEWFAPKRYGYGAGLPISWQGWALTIGFISLACVLAFTMSNRPLQLIAVLAPFVIGFSVICARTTRGGWRWRWGDED
jgi:NhaP-type Na+/H+ or K+/H+ antiporter